MAIYTKTGDRGETGIIGKRLSKNSITIQTVGAIDELNASIGVAMSLMKEPNDQLAEVQSTLFSIGAIIARGKIEVEFSEKTKKLEKSIDEMDKILKPLKNFILPGGTPAAAHVHLARTICRRSERTFVDFLNTTEMEDERFKEILKYLNRLSDYLFTLARYVNHIEGFNEIGWREK